MSTDAGRGPDQGVVEKIDEDHAEATEETSRDICPECEGDVSTHGREVVCEGCGLVLEEHLIDHGPEWRAFCKEDRDKLARTGSARTERLHDHGLTTQIGWGQHSPSEDGNGYQLSRLRKWHRRASRSRLDRNLARILSEARRISSGMELGDAIIDRACRLSRESHDDGEAIGASLESIAAASVLAAARDEGVPIAADNILERTDVNRRRLWSKYHDICEVCSVTVRPIEPVECIPSIASEVDLPDEVRRLAEGIAIEAADRGLHSGRKPDGIAAACIYVAALHLTPFQITQRDLSEASSVCSVTIRNARDQLVESGLVVDTGGDDDDFEVNVEVL